MGKKVVLSMTCTILISTLCHGTCLEDNIDTENNLSSDYIEISAKGRPPIKPDIYGKQQKIQEMRERLLEYDVLLKEYMGVLARRKEVLAEIYKKISFYCGLPAGVICGICGVIFLWKYYPDLCRPVDKKIVGGVKGNEESVIHVKDPFSLISTYVIFGLGFGISYYLITNICYAVKAGLFFSEWNCKEQLEEKLAEHSAAITSLGALLSKEEVLTLAKEFGENKELRKLLADILLTKGFVA